MMTTFDTDSTTAYFDYIRRRIKKFREEKGTSPEKMAQLLNMDLRNYRRIESFGPNRHKHLDLDLLKNIADALEKEWVDLVVPEGFIFAPVQHNTQAANIAAFIADHPTSTTYVVPKEIEERISSLEALIKKLIQKA